jgi:hypothetical protein
MAEPGRPEFKVTDTLRRQVAIAAGGGMSHEEIAIAIGCSRNTLEKHFAAEISEGALKRRFEVMQALFRAATGKGKRVNVTAAKAYLATPAFAAPPPPHPHGEEDGEKPGKKEQADIDARNAADGTPWGSILTTKTPLQ